MKKSILIIGLALYAVGVGAESRWIPLGESKDRGTITLIDANSIKRTSRQVSAWLKHLHTDNSSGVVYMTYYCATGESKAAQYATYDAQGNTTERGEEVFV